MMTRRMTWFSIAAACLAAAGAVAQPLQGSAGLSRTGSKVQPPTTDIPREGCVTTDCHPGIKDRPNLHGPVRVNACDACHTLADAAKHQFKPVSPRQETCTLCHAPEKPPGAMVHEPFAKGECLACHDPHGGAEPPLLRGKKYADTCATCHSDKAAGHDTVHGPVAVGACGACHQPHISTHPKLLNAEGRDLCLKCHVRTGMQIDAAPVVHAPVLGDCAVCHDSHATDNPSLLLEKTAALCTQCHRDIADTLGNATTQHGAITTKQACIACHTPHAGTHTSLLKREPRDLCFDCHDRPIPLPDGSKLQNMKALIDSGQSLHGALTQRGCVECHSIHGSDHRRLLNNEYPSELYYPFSESSYALCFSCHDRQLVLESKTNSATSFRNGDTNLHAVHVVKGKGRSCKICHDAHAARQDRHIRENVPFGESGWKMPLKYQKLDQGGRCAGACHDTFEYNRDQPVKYPPRPAGASWKGEELIPGSRSPDSPSDRPANPSREPKK